MQHMHAAGTAQVAEARSGMLADEKPGKEHHRDDEHHAGRDADPRQHLEQPAGASAIGDVAAGRERRRRVGGQRRCGRGLSRFGHAFDNADVHHAVRQIGAVYFL